MEHNAENNLNCKGPVQELLGEEFSDIERILGIFLAKKYDCIFFCPYPKNQSEANLKSCINGFRRDFKTA